MIPGWMSTESWVSLRINFGHGVDSLILVIHVVHHIHFYSAENLYSETNKLEVKITDCLLAIKIQFHWLLLFSPSRLFDADSKWKGIKII